VPKQHIRRGKEARKRRQEIAKLNAISRASRSVQDQFAELSKRVGDSKKERTRLWPDWYLGF
jgi:hypothetical protein